ncbi:serine protease AprX [Geodermatophilus sp. DSM 45219]|nr:serine protease AprX [Geodermatophilus sp. DSM 45219]
MTARQPGKEARPRPAARATVLAMASATLVGMGVTPTAAAATAPEGPLVPVIVEGSADAAAAEVQRLGGVVDLRLDVLDGLQARVPADRLAALTQVEGVRAVTPDGTLVPLDERWGDDTTGEGLQATLSTGTWQAAHDMGSIFSITRDTGAQTVWGKSDPNDGNRKLTGHGVGIALLDTGVTRVPGLDAAGKVVDGPDLSLDSQAANTRSLDAYGHGTHMAGLIAGRDSAAPRGNEADQKWFAGMAPDAKIVNVKAGASDGAVDVSQVVAGIDWVVTNRASHDIRVLNLSYGTDSTQSSQLDPLAHAVESAWRAGIVVVVAAGNDGESGPRPLTMPAIDPYVIAVGSSDNRGTAQPEDDTVGAWTNSGTTTRRPDVLAPGKSVVSLRVPGSWADVGHPEGLVPGDPTQRLFRGTGTSQSAAVVSGAAALLLQRNPRLTPDQVKGLLAASADRLMRDASPVQGAGVLDVKGAVELLEKGSVPGYTQTHARSTGTGSLDASRGGSHIADPLTGALLTGEQDVFGAAWDARSWAAASTTGTAWQGGVWRGSTWAGGGWVGGAWAPVAWTTPSWTGIAWSDRTWTQMRFESDGWERARWRGDDWTRARWRSDDWSRARWRVADGW